MQTKPPIFPQRKKAFTLVELIIVITILAILATIAFVSFQGYSSQSRDSNRVATVKNIENGVNIFITKTGKVPEPDDVIGSGRLTSGGPVLNIVGKVGAGITRSINLNETPLDPRAQEQYWYGVDTLKRYFQVGLTLESETAFAPGILPTYAGNILEAKVQGNYEYPLKLDSIVYSLPSLLFLGSGGVLNNQTEFVVDEGNNVPYTFGQVKSGTQSVSEVLKIITGTGNLSLTGISLPTMTMSDYKASTGSEIPNTFSGVAQLLGITDKNKLGVVVYGKEFVGVGVSGGNASNNSCDDTTKPVDNGHINFIIGSPISENQAYVQNASNCGYSCKDGYTGSTCDIAPFICGGSVSAGGFNYPTKLGPDGKCWTKSNMKHLPSPGLFSTCYNGNLQNCNSGRLYTGKSAKDSSVCPALGTGWALPTDAQWTALTNAGATGWDGNKFNGIVEVLQGDYYKSNGFYHDINNNGYWWSSTNFDVSRIYYRELINGSTSVVRDYSTDDDICMSVVCIKN